MKLKTGVSYNPCVTVKMTYLDGKEVELRRCGMIPDLFASKEGEIYRIRRCRIAEVAGQPTMRYLTNNIMARHLVLDAWRPGWDIEGELVKSKDGSLAEEQLYVAIKSRGRPRSNKMLRQLQAVEIVQCLAGDIKATAEEIEESQLFVEEAIRQWAPWLIEQEEEQIGRRPRFHRAPIDVD